MGNDGMITVPKEEMVKLIDEISTQITRLEKRIKIMELKVKRLLEEHDYID